MQTPGLILLLLLSTVRFCLLLLRETLFTDYIYMTGDGGMLSRLGLTYLGSQVTALGAQAADCSGGASTRPTGRSTCDAGSSGHRGRGYCGCGHGRRGGGGGGGARANAINTVVRT